MATAVLVDASVAASSEWVNVVKDYIGPQLNHVSGKFLDHQVRNGLPDRWPPPADVDLDLSFGSLSSRMGCHPRARVPFFVSDTSASLRPSRETVWRFQSSLDLGK